MKPSVAVNGLDYVNTSYTTPYGLVKSNWKKQSGHFDWTITIPANSKAIVYLPAEKVSDITCDGKALSALSGAKTLFDDNSETKVEIGSGDYHFEINNYGK